MKYLLLSLLLFTFNVHADSLTFSKTYTDYSYNNNFTNALSDSSNGYAIDLKIDLGRIGSGKLGIGFGYADLGTGTRTFYGNPTSFKVTKESVYLSYNNNLVRFFGMNLDYMGTVGIVNASATTVLNSFSRSHSDTGYEFGSGLALQVTPELAVTAMYKRLHNLSFDSGYQFEYSINNFGLGLRVNI